MWILDFIRGFRAPGSQFGSSADGFDHLRFVHSSRKAFESVGWTTEDPLDGRFDFAASDLERRCRIICWTGTREILELAIRTLEATKAERGSFGCIIAEPPVPDDMKKSGAERGALLLAFEDIARINEILAHAETLSELVREQIAKGDLDSAEQAIQRALLFRPVDPILIKRMSELLARRGEIKRATGWAERAAGLDRSNPWLLYHLAGLYLTAGELDMAERTSRDGLVLDPSHAGLMHRLSEVERRHGRLDAARELLVRAASAEPSSPWPIYHLVGVLIAQGNLDEAEQAIAKGLESDAEHAGLMQRRSEIARRRGDFATAKSWAERATTAQPGNPWLMHHLALVYLQSDEVEAAGQTVAHGLSILPNHAGLLTLRDTLLSRVSHAERNQAGRTADVESGS